MNRIVAQHPAATFAPRVAHLEQAQRVVAALATQAIIARVQESARKVGVAS